jgi:hypothetical protein
MEAKSPPAYSRKKDKLAGVPTLFTFLRVLVLIIIIVLSNYFYLLRI